MGVCSVRCCLGSGAGARAQTMSQKRQRSRLACMCACVCACLPRAVPWKWMGPINLCDCSCALTGPSRHRTPTDSHLGAFTTGIWESTNRTPAGVSVRLSLTCGFLCPCAGCVALLPHNGFVSGQTLMVCLTVALLYRHGGRGRDEVDPCPRGSAPITCALPC